jgi:hypothetical protein
MTPSKNKPKPKLPKYHQNPTKLICTITNNNSSLKTPLDSPKKPQKLPDKDSTTNIKSIKKDACDNSNDSNSKTNNNNNSTPPSSQPSTKIQKKYSNSPNPPSANSKTSTKPSNYPKINTQLKPPHKKNTNKTSKIALSTPLSSKLPKTNLLSTPSTPETPPQFFKNFTTTIKSNKLSERKKSSICQKDKKK